MIENRGTIKLGTGDEPGASDAVVVIEAFDEAERLRAHELMLQNWTLIGLTRRRSTDGAAYTEYRLRAARPGE
jgi:hypothetical protein